MPAPPDSADQPIPLDSLIFGYGPMLPLAAAALGAWLLPPPWPAIATRLAIVWGAMILVFIGGVRRGFGFGRSGASTANEVVTMIVYFTIGGLALIMPSRIAALASLAIGLPLAAVCDRWAARRGDAPGFFATLRPPQMAVGAAALAALIARFL